MNRARDGARRDGCARRARMTRHRIPAAHLRGERRLLLLVALGFAEVPLRFLLLPFGHLLVHGLFDAGKPVHHRRARLVNVRDVPRLETVDLPDGVARVGDLVPHLAAMSDGHALALQNLQVVRVAVNRAYGDLDTPVAAGDEVAFFPPVTGG